MEARLRMREVVSRAKGTSKGLSTTERTVVRDTSFLSALWGANAGMVDAKYGKVLCIRPARYYDKYTKEESLTKSMRSRPPIDRATGDVSY